MARNEPQTTVVVVHNNLMAPISVPWLIRTYAALKKLRQRGRGVERPQLSAAGTTAGKWDIHLHLRSIFYFFYCP